jgi:serine/threonine protein phosphatase 1
MPNRTIAIGDIHGCSLALDALIAAIHPRPEDLIVTLGDCIHRGPDSRGVIDRLIDLKHDCNLVPLLGNHEEMLFDARTGRHQITWLGMGGIATLDSYGPGRDLSLIPEEHFKFLEGFLDYYETDTHIFLHASYDPDLPMDKQDVGMLRWESLRGQIPGPHSSGKTIIAGHTSQRSGEILDLGYLKCIDTYCYGGGWLTALEVNTGKVWRTNQRGEHRRG